MVRFLQQLRQAKLIVLFLLWASTIPSQVEDDPRATMFSYEIFTVHLWLFLYILSGEHILVE